MENIGKLDSQDGKWKKGFFILTGGQAVSLVGSSAVQFALIWWLATETGSPFVLAIAGLFAFLPQFFLGPFAGVWIDRWKRKNVIIGADIFVGLSAAALALSMLFRGASYEAVYLVLALRAIGNVFHVPAIQAVVPRLVPTAELVRANSWSQFLQSGAFMLGPVVGAAMYAAWSLPFILLSDLVGALIAALAVLLVQIPEIKPVAQVRPDFFGEMKAGAKLYLKDRKLIIVTLASVITMIFSMPLAVFYPLMTSDYFKLGAWHASIVEFSFALGMMLGAIVISRIKIENKLGTVYLGLLALSIVTFFSGVLPQDIVGFWAFSFLSLLMGMSINLYNIPYVAYLQETIPHEAQGRVFSLFGGLMSVTMPVGLLVAGPVAQQYGVSLWFVVAGVAMLVIPAFSQLAVSFFRPEKK